MPTILTYTQFEGKIPNIETSLGQAALNTIIAERESEYLRELLGDAFYVLWQAGLEDTQVEYEVVSSIPQYKPPVFIAMTAGQKSYSDATFANWTIESVERKGFGTDVPGVNIDLIANGWQLRPDEDVYGAGDIVIVRFQPRFALVTSNTIVDLSLTDMLSKALLYCIWYWYLRRDATQSTGTGEKNVEAQNASNAGSVDKQVQAWNEMVRENRKIVEYLRSTYPSYTHLCANLLTTINPYF